jgi:hypothetical protein
MGNDPEKDEDADPADWRRSGKGIETAFIWAICAEKNVCLAQAASATAW